LGFLYFFGKSDLSLSFQNQNLNIIFHSAKSFESNFTEKKLIFSKSSQKNYFLLKNRKISPISQTMDEFQFDAGIDAEINSMEQIYFANGTNQDGTNQDNGSEALANLFKPDDTKDNLDFDTFLETCVTPRLEIQHHPVDPRYFHGGNGTVIPTESAESKPEKRKYTKRKNVETPGPVGPAGVEPPAKKQRKPYKPRAPKIKEDQTNEKESKEHAIPFASEPTMNSMNSVDPIDLMTFDQFDRFQGFQSEAKKESIVVPAAPSAPILLSGSILTGSFHQKNVNTADISIFIPKTRVSKTRSAINASACWAVYQRFLLYGQSEPATKDAAVSMTDIRDASIKLFAQSVARQCKIDGEITQDEIPTKEEFIINELFDHQRIAPPRKNMFMTNCHYTVLLSILNGQSEEARSAAFTAISKKNNNRQNQAIFRSKKGGERGGQNVKNGDAKDTNQDIPRVPKRRGRPPKIPSSSIKVVD